MIFGQSSNEKSPRKQFLASEQNIYEIRLIHKMILIFIIPNAKSCDRIFCKLFTM